MHQTKLIATNHVDAMSWSFDRHATFLPGPKFRLQGHQGPHALSHHR